MLQVGGGPDLELLEVLPRQAQELFVVGAQGAPGEHTESLCELLARLLDRGDLLLRGAFPEFHAGCEPRVLLAQHGVSAPLDREADEQSEGRRRQPDKQRPEQGVGTVHGVPGARCSGGFGIGTCAIPGDPVRQFPRPAHHPVGAPRLGRLVGVDVAEQGDERLHAGAPPGLDVAPGIPDV